MKICIDTNIYTAYKKGDSSIIKTLEEVDFVYIPSIVLGELYAGFYIGANTKVNISELEEFLAVPGIEVVQVNQEIAEKYGYLVKTLRNQGTPIPTNDIWIAATALELSAKLLSFDKHFNHIPGILRV
jgi:tRNA(fMet)-specific endonuclease VapC